jgi:hypothetical protein
MSPSAWMKLACTIYFLLLKRETVNSSEMSANDYQTKFQKAVLFSEIILHCQDQTLLVTILNEQ